MEMTNPSLIAGVFRTQMQADRASDELKQAGFRADQISSTVYNLNAVPEAQESAEVMPDQSRIVVAVIAEGREQDAVSIFANNGANNADLPPGLVLEHGALVSSQPETSTTTSDQQIDAAAGFSGDSFFPGQRILNQPGDTNMMDNTALPHG